jgi:hypothetical protein
MKWKENACIGDEGAGQDTCSNPHWHVSLSGPQSSKLWQNVGEELWQMMHIAGKILEQQQAIDELEGRLLY